MNTVKNNQVCFIERRSNTSRRSKSFGGFRWQFLPGRRRHVRRKRNQREIHILDYYSPKLFYFLVATLLLSVVDALLTLWLIDHGAVELNQIMAYYLDKGPKIFMAVKYFLTATVITITVLINYVYFQFFRMHVGSMLKIFSGCFTCVVIWELFLIVRFVV